MKTQFLDYYKQFHKLKMRQSVTEFYSSTFVPITKNMIYIRRQHTWKSDTIDMDIHSKYWSVAFFKENSETSLSRLGEKIKVCPNKILFIPPYSIFQWHILKGHGEWEAFICKSEMKFHSYEPILYDAPESIPIFENEYELLEFVKVLPAGKLVGYRNKHSVVADKVKSKLDLSFPNFPTMSDLAQELNLRLPSLDREFKSTYGLSPREYNIRQRTLATALFMFFSENIPINQVATEMGFQHMANFYKQCLRYLNTKPSLLKTKKIIENNSNT